MTAEEGPAKLVSIVTEAAVETLLLREIEAMGIDGYTITDVRGRGTRGRRSGSWDASASIRVDVVCAPVRAEALALRVKERFAPGYALFIFICDAWVP